MADAREEAIRKEAHRRWETEKCPDGYHDRHWHEAESQVDTGVPQTWSQDQSGFATPSNAPTPAVGDASAGDDDIPVPPPFVSGIDKK